MAAHAVERTKPAPTRARAAAQARAQRLVGRALVHLLLAVGAVLLMVPFYWAVTSSLKTGEEVRLLPPQWLPSTPHWENYAQVMGSTLFGRWLRNTVFITVVAVAGTVVTSAAAGYAFARLRFRGRNLLFVLTLGTLMLPAEVTLISTYLLYYRIGWLNTYLPLTVPSWLGGGAFFIFLFRQFFLTIPRELDDAAKIDGASYPGIFFHILLPLSLPVIATAAIISFIQHWNSFILPLIILNDRTKYTLAIGLRFFATTPVDAKAQDHLLLAMSVLMTLPIIVLFFAFQRYFVRGVVMSGIKG